MPEISRIPSAGSLGAIADSCVPKNGFLGPKKIGESVWIVRKLFSLGADQHEGLAYKGLRSRLLGLLGDQPLNHPALDREKGESTPEQITEERRRVADLVSGEFNPFPLDSTMTIVRTEGRLVLHSVVPLDPELLSAVRSLGEVSLILVPNLQHWLFLEEWLAEFPNASVGVVPSACDEDLLEKMKFLQTHQGEVLDLDNGLEDALVDHGLVGHHLEGAPLSLNEYLFFHAASGTLLASDSFYGGYSDAETPTWFARLWFKLTKSGSFRAARLPIYRTSRVLSHGNQARVYNLYEPQVNMIV